MTVVDHDSLAKANRLAMSEIFEIINIDICAAYDVKEKLIKVANRLDPVSANFVMNTFYLVQVANNLFTNCVLLNKEPRCYARTLQHDLIDLAESILSQSQLDCNQHLIIGSDESCTGLFIDLVRPVVMHLFEEHQKTIGDSNRGLVTKIKALEAGKYATLSSYISCITLLYGFRFFRSKELLVFYMQPQYLDINIGGCTYAEYVADCFCKKALLVDQVSCVMSYRLCDPEFTRLEGRVRFNPQSLSRTLKVSDCFRSLTIAFKDNTMMSEGDKRFLQNRGVIFDDGADLFDIAGEGSNSAFCLHPGVISDELKRTN